MTISHLCMTCGTDLARVRAPLDPHYGLPVVVCPACATAVVRRVHPLRRFHRSAIRLATTLVALGLQVQALLVFVFATTMICAQLGDQPFGRLFRSNEAGEVFVLLVSLGLLPIAIGAWLRAGLSHWRPTIAWAVFTGVVALLLAADTLIWPAVERVLQDRWSIDNVSNFRPVDWLSRLRLLAIMMLVATAGIPVGRLLLARADYLRGVFRNTRRRRARLRSAVR